MLIFRFNLPCYTLWFYVMAVKEPSFVRGGVLNTKTYWRWPVFNIVRSWCGLGWGWFFVLYNRHTFKGFNNRTQKSITILLPSSNYRSKFEVSFSTKNSEYNTNFVVTNLLFGDNAIWILLSLTVTQLSYTVQNMVWPDHGAPINSWLVHDIIVSWYIWNNFQDLSPFFLATPSVKRVIFKIMKSNDDQCETYKSPSN